MLGLPFSFSDFSSFSHRLLALTSCFDVILRLNMLSMTRVPILAKLMSWCRAAASRDPAYGYCQAMHLCCVCCLLSVFCVCLHTGWFSLRRKLDQENTHSELHSFASRSVHKLCRHRGTVHQQGLLHLIQQLTC